MTYLSNCRSVMAVSHTFKSTFIPLSLIIAACAVTPQTAYAQRVNPMAYDLTPSGSDSTEALRVENTSQVTMTLEITAKKISIDAQGKETTEPAEDDFLIFPPQAILKPGKTQAVRVKYIGDPAISQSEVYRIIISQVPVDLTGEGESAVGLVVNFHTLAGVNPKGSTAELSVTSIKPNGAGGWDLEINNSGNRYARLSRTTWDVTDGANSKSLSSEDVAKMTDKNLLLPGATMTVSIPALEGFNSVQTRVKINAPS